MKTASLKLTALAIAAHGTLVLLTAAAAQIEWQQSFGGTSWDSLQIIRQTSDGGYMLAGHSRSGVSGNKTSPNFGLFDYWVIRVDPSGEKVWEQSFGGTDNDHLFALAILPDDGCVVGGASTSAPNGNKTTARSRRHRTVSNSSGGLQPFVANKPLGRIDAENLCCCLWCNRMKQSW